MIEAGADANAVTAKGSWGGDLSVPMFALGAEDGYLYERYAPPPIDPDLIALLIQKGAGIDDTNRSGISPMRLAEAKKHRAVLKLLKSATAV